MTKGLNDSQDIRKHRGLSDKVYMVRFSYSVVPSIVHDASVLYNHRYRSKDI